MNGQEADNKDIMEKTEKAEKLIKIASITKATAVLMTKFTNPKLTAYDWRARSVAEIKELREHNVVEAEGFFAPVWTRVKLALAKRT